MRLLIKKNGFLNKSAAEIRLSEELIRNKEFLMSFFLKFTK